MTHSDMGGEIQTDSGPRASPDLPDVTRRFRSASAEMLGAILDQSMDCIKVIGPTGQLDFMNRNGRCAMEIDDFAMVAGRNWWELWPEESRPLVLDAVERARRGESYRFEAFCPTAKGSPRWWEVSASPLRDEAGELQGIISVSRDITERVRAREIRETAAAEMRHRLLNAYTLAAAIVSSTARGSDEREEFATEILRRLEQLSIAQSLLLNIDALGTVDLPTLVQRLTEPFRGGACELVFHDLPVVILGDDDVRALALVLGELSTNSNKYGALRRGGSIGIKASVKDGVLGLHWSERALGHAPAPHRGGGSGHRLIERALRARGGELTIEWRDDGPDVNLSLPLSRD